MKIILLILAFYTCKIKAQETSNKIEIGMLISEAIEILKIDSTNLHTIQEPPGIYRAVVFNINDSTVLNLNIERTLSDFLKYFDDKNKKARSIYNQLEDKNIISIMLEQNGKIESIDTYKLD